MLRFAVSLRFILLIACAGTAVGALVMFWEGAARMINAIYAVTLGHDPKGAIAQVMGGTDAFLFGIVLVIFAFNIAFGFVFELSKAEKQGLPAWMRPSGMRELKLTLVGVILVYLIVDFATDWAESNFADSWVMLVKPISILLIAATYRLLAMPEPGDAKEP
jgi:uncharacterized membrane protein YqhA